MDRIPVRNGCRGRHVVPRQQNLGVLFTHVPGGHHILSAWWLDPGSGGRLPHHLPLLRLHLLLPGDQRAEVEAWQNAPDLMAAR